MNISELMQAMSDAGAPMEAIIIAVRAVEAKDKELADKRAVERDRKRRQRAKDTDGTVTGQSRDTDGTVTDEPLSRPPNENNSNPPTHTRENISRVRKADPFSCPVGVDPVDWDGLKANRKAKRAALSPAAHRQITNKLDMWARAGWPPGPIVAHAVERGWTTVFETDEMKVTVNEHRNGSKPSTGKVDGFTTVLREVARREHEPPGAHHG